MCFLSLFLSFGGKEPWHSGQKSWLFNILKDNFSWWSPFKYFHDTPNIICVKTCDRTVNNIARLWDQKTNSLPSPSNNGTVIICRWIKSFIKRKLLEKRNKQKTEALLQIKYFLKNLKNSEVPWPEIQGIQICSQRIIPMQRKDC